MRRRSFQFLFWIAERVVLNIPWIRKMSLQFATGWHSAEENSERCVYVRIYFWKRQFFRGTNSLPCVSITQYMVYYYFSYRMKLQLSLYLNLITLPPFFLPSYFYAFSIFSRSILIWYPYTITNPARQATSSSSIILLVISCLSSANGNEKYFPISIK